MHLILRKSFPNICLMEIFIGDRGIFLPMSQKLTSQKIEFVVSYQLEMATKARENVFSKFKMNKNIYKKSLNNFQHNHRHLPHNFILSSLLYVYLEIMCWGFLVTILVVCSLIFKISKNLENK